MTLDDAFGHLIELLMDLDPGRKEETLAALCRIRGELEYLKSREASTSETLGKTLELLSRS